MAWVGISTTKMRSSFAIDAIFATAYGHTIHSRPGGQCFSKNEPERQLGTSVDAFFSCSEPWFTLEIPAVQDIHSHPPMSCGPVATISATTRPLPFADATTVSLHYAAARNSGAELTKILEAALLAPVEQLARLSVPADDLHILKGSPPKISFLDCGDFSIVRTEQQIKAWAAPRWPGEALTTANRKRAGASPSPIL